MRCILYKIAFELYILYFGWPPGEIQLEGQYQKWGLILFSFTSDEVLRIDVFPFITHVNIIIAVVFYILFLFTADRDPTYARSSHWFRHTALVGQLAALTVANMADETRFPLHLNLEILFRYAYSLFGKELDHQIILI